MVNYLTTVRILTKLVWSLPCATLVTILFSFGLSDGNIHPFYVNFVVKKVKYAKKMLRKIYQKSKIKTNFSLHLFCSIQVAYRIIHIEC